MHLVFFVAQVFSHLRTILGIGRITLPNSLAALRSFIMPKNLNVLLRMSFELLLLHWPCKLQEIFTLFSITSKSSAQSAMTENLLQKNTLFPLVFSFSLRNVYTIKEKLLSDRHLLSFQYAQEHYTKLSLLFMRSCSLALCLAQHVTQSIPKIYKFFPFSIVSFFSLVSLIITYTTE